MIRSRRTTHTIYTNTKNLLHIFFRWIDRKPTHMTTTMAISSSVPLQHEKPTNHENDGTENEDYMNTFHNREETLTDDIDQIKNHDEDDEDDDDDDGGGGGGRNRS